jgi:hypothetical protein
MQHNGMLYFKSPGQQLESENYLKSKAKALNSVPAFRLNVVVFTQKQDRLSSMNKQNNLFEITENE